MCDPLLETSTCFGIFVKNFKWSNNNKVFSSFFFFLFYILFLGSEFYVESLISAVEICFKFSLADYFPFCLLISHRKINHDSHTSQAIRLFKSGILYSQNSCRNLCQISWQQSSTFPMLLWLKDTVVLLHRKQKPTPPLKPLTLTKGDWSDEMSGFSPGLYRIKEKELE